MRSALSKVSQPIFIKKKEVASASTVNDDELGGDHLDSGEAV